MDTKDYNKLKQQVEGKYQETVLLAEKERKDGLDAIERVWNLLKETEQIPIVEIRDQAKEKVSYGDLTAAVQKAVAIVSKKRFTKNDIKLVLPQVSAEIANSCKDASLAGCLKRLQRRHIIEKIKAGKGRAPSIYKVVSTKQE